jgi:mRNA interferase MazF
MRRGEVWEADIGGRVGKRPVLILTRSAVLPHLSKVVVAEITTQGKGYPTQISIGQHANLRKSSYVSAEALHTLPKERLVRFLGNLPDSLMNKVNDAIIFALELMG